MTAIVITGMASVRPGPAATAEDVRPHRVHRVAEFDPEAAFGRRATRFNHRSTLLVMTACEAAIRNAALTVTDDNRGAVGITVGTTVGSVSGTVEFGTDSFDRSRPYLVDAASFPNMVLNTAAGALAIRLGAQAANATVAGGPTAGVAALRYGELALRAGHATTMLVGASEEATAPAVWWAQSARATGAVGEGAAVFVLEHEDTARAAGRTPVARLAATTVRVVDPADAGALADALAEALRRAAVEPGAVELVALRETGVAAVDRAQRAAVAAVLTAPLMWSEDEIGDCYSAHSALQLARVIEHLTSGRESQGRQSQVRGSYGPKESAGVVMATDPDGAVGLAVVALEQPAGGRAGQAGPAGSGG
jgi:3-oxoacyl-[acyl-carrier-protein] synthase II